MSLVIMSGYRVEEFSADVIKVPNQWILSSSKGKYSAGGADLIR